ncbi:hypothetical protein KBD71_05355 [Candidatus Woesebacteria bacterium]|nr:hypothetical protein [Candidatus Woesebacteria bacterium]
MPNPEDRVETDSDGELKVADIVRYNPKITVQDLKNPEILAQLVRENRIQVTSRMQVGSGKSIETSYKVSILPAGAELGKISAPYFYHDPTILEYEAEDRTYSVQTLVVDETLKKAIDRALKPRWNPFREAAGLLKHKRKK